MQTSKLQAGDVVRVAVNFGGQHKVRPAIVLEVGNRGVYVALGTTKNLINDKSSFVVNEDADMRAMGLKFHTRFSFGHEADQWVESQQVERIVGHITAQTVSRLGQAWANSRFVRAH